MTNEATFQTDPLFNNSVAKAFKVLEAFDAERRDLSLVEIVKLTGLNKSSAQRFSHTLHQLGYLEKDPASRRYFLSNRILESANNFLQTNPLIARATPFIVEIRRQFDGRVGLNTRRVQSIMYLVPLQSNKEAFQTAHPGFRVPLYCSSAGRMLLADLDEVEAKNILTSSNIVKQTDKTLIDVDEIMDEVRIARKQGFCITDQQYHVGDINLSAPITDGKKGTIAAITITMPRTKWSQETMAAQVAPILVQAARAISF